MVCRVMFGTSIPIVDLPGMRSIKIDSACSARHKSSVSPMIRLYLIPASGLNSNVVTTGPRIDLRHASLNVEFEALGFNRARAVLQFIFIKLLATLSLSQQRGRRKFIVGIALGDLWLASLLGDGFLRPHKENRFLPPARHFLFLLFLFFRVKYVALIRKLNRLAGSFVTAAVPNDCGATGFRPEIRVSSTRRRIRSCSRSSRHECQRAAAFCRIPSLSTAPIGPFGPVAQACVPANENLVAINNAVKKAPRRPAVAPQKLNPVSKLLEISDPSIPPGGYRATQLRKVPER